MVRRGDNPRQSYVSEYRASKKSATKTSKSARALVPKTIAGMGEISQQLSGAQGGASGAVSRGLFEGVGDLQHAPLVAVAPNNLYAHG